MTSDGTVTDQYELDTEMGVDETLAAVEQAAELWGADWARQGRSGRIRLPVNSGVRTGLLDGHLAVTSRPGGTKLSFDVEQSRYETNRQAVALLVAGGLGGLVLMLWPFFPVLLGFAPVAIVMLLITWFVVVSRIRNNGPREFLDFVLEQAGMPEGDPAERL